MIKHAGDDAPIRRRVNFQNIPVAIEYPAGSVKLGQDEQGNTWSRVYLLDYGFIEGGPNSGDGETMDVYLGPHQSARYVYLVNQLTKQGEFDETKCMLGFASEEEAVQGYLRHYPEGWEKDRVQDVKTKTLEQFKAWLRGGETAKAASRTDKAWITPEGKILSVDDVAALEHAELVPAGIVTDADATASALKAGWVRVGKFSPGMAYMEIGVPVTREVLHRVQTALTGTAYDTDRYMVDTPRRVGYLDREDMFASVSPERFVSRIQKVGSHKNKTAALCLRLWITPDAEVKEFPASWGHAGYAQRLFEAEDPPRNVLMGKAVDELENMKWARVGVWHQEMYVSGRPLTDAQLHALQAHIANDPSWQSPRSVVISSGGRDVTLSFDEFMALDHITDAHRHKLASRKDTVQKIKTFTTDEGTFSIWDVDANHRRPDMFTVWEHPEGWIVRNVLIPENLLRQGVATRTYTALNMLSLQATGHPLRSTQARTRLRGEQVLELSDEGRALWDSFVSKGHAEPVGDTYRFKTSAMVTAVGRSPLQPWQMTRDQYLTAMEANKHLPPYEEPHRVSRRDTRHPWTVLETFEIEDYSATIEVSDEGGKSYAWDHTKGDYARDEHGDLVPHGTVYHKQVAAFIGDTRIGYAGDSFGAIEMFVAPKFQRYGVSTRLLHWYHRLYPNATSGGTTSAGYAFLREFHKKAVTKALREGKDVPENVLAEYPDLHATPRGTEQEQPVPERNPPTEKGPGSHPRDEDAPALPRMRKDYTDYKDLPSRAFSKDETIRMGADGMIATKAYLRYIRLDKIEGHEPMPHAEDMEFAHGTPITQPVEVWYDAETDTYMLYAGNHRVVQATYNGDSYILAFVQPDRGKIGPDATTSAAEAFPGLAGGQKAASVKLAALRKVTLKPTTLYHGTRASFNEAEEDLQGPAWVSDTLAVAKRFAGEQSRVIEYRLGSPVTVWKIESAQDLSRLAAKYGLDPDEVDHYELAETVDGGWIIPKNYQGPAAGADILLSDPTVLTYVQTHLPDGTAQVREQDENDADAMHKHAGSTANALLKEALGQSEHLGDAFHTWFKGSRIVDAKGQPLRVFHGTWKDFGQDGWFSEGQGGYIYVTPDPSYASTYSGDEGAVMPLYAHARNPLDLRGLGVGEVSQSRVIQALKQAGVTPPEALLRLRGLRPMFQWVKMQDFKEAVQAQGHDAIWIKERTSDAKGDALLLFDAKQLKSATGNRGTWDPEDARLIASRTASFESWFKGSKVVDAHGQPLKVYKGMWPYDWTKETETDKGPLIDSIGRGTAFPAFDPTDTEPVHLAGFFAADPEVASHFAGKGGSVFPVYLSIKHPYVIHADGKPAGAFQFGPEGRPFRDAIRSGKYDGVFLLGTSDEGDVYVALRPNQIKSALGSEFTEDHRLTAAAKEAAIPGLEGTKVLWDGKPLKVYHGTAAEFTEFKQDFVGQNFGDAAGFFFTNNTSHDAQWVQNPSDTGGMATRYDEHGVPVRPSDPRYNHLRVWEDDTSAGAYAMNSKGPGEAAIIPAYINLKNPLVIDKDLDGGGILSAIESRSQPAGTFIKNEVLGQGYDGLIVIDRDIQFKNGQPEILVVATRPDQIIPAIGKTASDDDEIGSGEHAATTDPTGKFWGEAGAGCVFVAKDTGRVLLPLRSEFVNEPHTWGVWGGAVDPHESPEAACRREVKEETGYTGPLTLTRAYVYRNGDFTYTTFLAHIPTEFTPELNWETEDFKWCEPGAWPQPLHFGLKEALPSITGALPATPHHVEAAGGRVGNDGAFDLTDNRITAAIIDEGTSHEAHPEGHQANTSNGPEGLAGEPHAAGRSSAVGRGGESAHAGEASGPQAEVWESTEVAARLRLEGWGFTRHVAHSSTILLSFNADDTLCAVSVHDPIPGRVTNQGMPIQSWAACISVPPTGYRASKRAASRLDLPPIKWATPTDAELLNEISTEYALEELFLLPTWPTKDDMAAAVPDMKACSHVEALDPSKIAGRHLWDSYEALKRTVTNFGGPKDPDSMVEAIKAGRPLPMPVVLHKRDGSYEVAGGNTRAGIAALAHQPIQAFVVDAAKAGQRMADKLIADAEAEWRKDDPALFDAVKAYYMANGPKPVITPDQGFAAYHLSATFGLALRQLGIDSEGKDVRLRPTLEAALINPSGSNS